MKVQQMYTHDDGSGELVVSLQPDEMQMFFEAVARQVCQDGRVNFDLFLRDE